MATTLVADPQAAAPPESRPARFAKLPDHLGDFGGIPINRIVINPWPGTATEQDVLEYGERIAPAELIDNTIVEKAMSFWEGRIAIKLAGRMDLYAEDHDLGLVNGADAQMRVVGGNVRLPDVTSTAKGRAPTTDVAVPDLSPDLIVEVLSDSNTKAEVDRKLGEFFEGGTRLSWVINRRTRTVTIYRGSIENVEVRGSDDTLDGEEVLPGFSIPIAKLFEGIPTD